MGNGITLASFSLIIYNAGNFNVRIGEATVNRSTFNSVLQALVLTSSALLLNGCASTPESIPTSYEVRASADQVINRDISGQPLSVVVRLYQLKQPKEFNALTFDLATSNRTDAELFGDSLIQRTEILMVPGTTHISAQGISPDAKFLGVVAFFRRPDTHYWRYLIDANQVRSKGLNFQALDCYLQLKNTLVVAIPGQPLDARPACLGENIAVPSITPTGTQAAPEVHQPRRPATVRTRPSPAPSTATPRAPPAQAPSNRVGRPATPLPAPPVSTVTVQVPTPATPSININVTPNLSLPKWGGQ